MNNSNLTMSKQSADGYKVDIFEGEIGFTCRVRYTGPDATFKSRSASPFFTTRAALDWAKSLILVDRGQRGMRAKVGY